MTQVWDDDNNVVPVTVVRVAPCRVVQVKTPDSDGYSALQVTYGSRDPRKLTKPVAGHYDKAGVHRSSTQGLRPSPRPPAEAPRSWLATTGRD